MVIHYTFLMERIPRTNRLVWKMESFCKICWNAKIKILSIKASTFHLISLDIQRIKFIDDTSSNARAIMTLNYRQVKVYISQQFGRSGITVTTDVNCLDLWTFVHLSAWRVTGGLNPVWSRRELKKLLSLSLTCSEMNGMKFD